MLLTYENIHEQLIIYYFKISYDALYHSKNLASSIGAEVPGRARGRSDSAEGHTNQTLLGLGEKMVGEGESWRAGGGTMTAAPAPVAGRPFWDPHRAGFGPVPTMDGKIKIPPRGEEHSRSHRSFAVRRDTRRDPDGGWRWQTQRWRWREQGWLPPPSQQGGGASSSQNSILVDWTSITLKIFKLQTKRQIGPIQIVLWLNKVDILIRVKQTKRVDSAEKTRLHIVLTS
jgi:hypothetical protein